MSNYRYMCPCGHKVGASWDGLPTFSQSKDCKYAMRHANKKCCWFSVEDQVAWLQFTYRTQVMSSPCANCGVQTIWDTTVDETWCANCGWDGVGRPWVGR